MEMQISKDAMLALIHRRVKIDAELFQLYNSENFADAADRFFVSEFYARANGKGIPATAEECTEFLNYMRAYVDAPADREGR